MYVFVLNTFTFMREVRYSKRLNNFLDKQSHNKQEENEAWSLTNV